MAEYSEPLSLKGYNFWEWFKGNWSTIKEIFKIGIPLVIGIITTDNALLIGTITLVGKFLMDLGDFYFTKVEIKPVSP